MFGEVLLLGKPRKGCEFQRTRHRFGTEKIVFVALEEVSFSRVR